MKRIAMGYLWLGSVILLGVGAACGESGVEIPEHDSEQGHAVVRLYDESVAALSQACDDYRRIRAMQLSMMRDIPFDEALANVVSVMPTLPPVNRILLRQRIYNPEDIVHHKVEVENVQRQVELMIELLAKLLTEIERIEGEIVQHHAAHHTVTLEERVLLEEWDPEREAEAEEQREEQVEVLAALIEAARDQDDDEQRFADLTPFMKEVTRDSVPPPVFVQGDDFEQMAAVMNLVSANYTFGRRIAAHGEPVEWMFLDTWYIIGPFPNPGRAHIHRQFPPETIVDLDATYIGKDGREVVWTFHQTRTVSVVPVNAEAYGIWYAYTEVHLDEAMDLWVVTGSDDRGDIWINDLPVWVSSDQLKSWRVDEGFRKVSFQRGRNRILFRLENGWHHMAFSLGIRTTP